MSKTQDFNPPDVRLAKAFNFSSSDLYANREGILSWRQRGFSDWLAYRILYFLRGLPFWRVNQQASESPKKQARMIESICGRIELEHNISNQALMRSALFYEYYQLIFPGHDRRFAITREQFSVLTENLRYRVYYQGMDDTSHILSIERVIGTCDG